ncbi:rifin [Plasmodium falciparum NF54]|uniref:Rifin n=2 Tax=Plasmodium falciparum TaxID=5833 RepID=Q8IM85_PLAF7|nr:rifin [Plasmodium falciparum 3D7]EWC86097.1 hypothetical protein PFNF54_04828 [Plasmodium falciparum NF54]KAF4329290.1 rifin [Plasmodium falciparum NF54]PKC49465.1 rifin [Plasmodium falciparum NF54]CZT99707.1 rifin [Plasmodium falciparum 3D7]|eukprot:XP_001348177.2 rifin [Plasmodium falciparum 3D7]
MKVHYINILLFALPLNILVYNQRNYYITPRHTKTTRSLCECKLYSPANYDSDPQMKEVMENYNRQTSDRFKEYDERMKTTRQKCREQCDKEIQKIILKDKLEKQMEQQLTKLETKITTEDIPTCVCEKSLADKVEKGCLKCGYGLGTVAPTVGLIGSVAVNVWKTTEIAAAIAAAEKTGAAQGAAAGLKAGVDAVITGLKERGVGLLCPKLLESIGDTIHYTDDGQIAKIILENLSTNCGVGNSLDKGTCMKIRIKLGMILPDDKIAPPDNIHIRQMMKEIVYEAKQASDVVAKNTADKVTKAAIKTSTEAIDAATYNWYTTISYSITAILIIVLIMVIIYLILRYRRKKKMKKKLQYIKLLEE